MNSKRRHAILGEVVSLLEEHGVDSPPVPIEHITETLGVDVRYSSLDNELSGMVYVKEGVPIIGVNALHHPNRQRFTIAHECGHFVLHKKQISKEVHVDKAFPMLMRDSLSAEGVDKMEIEANFFAAELLMPRQLLTRELGPELLDIDDEQAVSSLARRFRVSVSAMRFRLTNLFIESTSGGRR